MPEYQRQKRPADLQAALKSKRRHTIFWLRERIDGCGQQAQFMLFAWALAKRKGFIYGGVLPNPHNHVGQHDVWRNDDISSLFSVDCSCMFRMLGLPEDLHDYIALNRAKHLLKSEHFLKEVGLKDRHWVPSNCEGRVIHSKRAHGGHVDLSGFLCKQGGRGVAVLR